MVCLTAFEVVRGVFQGDSSSSFVAYSTTAPAGTRGSRTSGVARQGLLRSVSRRRSVCRADKLRGTAIEDLSEALLCLISAGASIIDKVGQIREGTEVLAYILRLSERLEWFLTWCSLGRVGWFLTW